MQGSQQQQSVVIPTNTGYVSQPYQTTSEVSSYSNRQSAAIGILLVIMGSLSIVFNIVDLAVGTKAHYTYSYYYPYTSLAPVYLSVWSLGVIGHGFWCGAMIIIAGGFGIGAGRHKNRCMIISFMVLAIICCVLAPIQLIIGAAGANDLKILYGAPNCRSSYNSQFCNDLKAVYSMEVMIALLGFGEFVLCLWGSILCCATGGCCGGRQATVIAMPVGQPQVTVISQQQQQPQNYQPQQVVYPSPVQYPGYAPQYPPSYAPQNPAAGYPPPPNQSAGYTQP